MKEYKNLTEAFSVFKKNAIEHGQHTMSGDHKLCNKCYKNIMNAVEYIASKGKYDGVIGVDAEMILEEFKNGNL